jgi:hypothetical protein
VIAMQIVITTNGNVKCLYGEDLDLHEFGQLEIRRGSHVEPTDDGCWTADLSPVRGPLLGPFPNRSMALDTERDWLEHHWLVPQSLTGRDFTAPLLNSKGAQNDLDVSEDH